MTISIPEFPLPFEIPHMIHPLFVHFAIALPVILLILELINLVAKRRLLTGINFFFMLLIVVVFFAAYLTGEADAKDINIEALQAHKQLGVYLVYGSLVVLFFKLISILIDKIQIKIFFYLALIAFIASSFIEGKRGGELVYKYGVNVKVNSELKHNKSEAKVESNATEEKTTMQQKDEHKTEVEKNKESNETKDKNVTKQKPHSEVAEQKPKEESTDHKAVEHNETQAKVHQVNEANITESNSQKIDENNSSEDNTSHTTE